MDTVLDFSLTSCRAPELQRRLSESDNIAGLKMHTGHEEAKLFLEMVFDDVVMPGTFRQLASVTHLAHSLSAPHVATRALKCIVIDDPDTATEVLDMALTFKKQDMDRGAEVIEKCEKILHDHPAWVRERLRPWQMHWSMVLQSQVQHTTADLVEAE